jgi:malonate-semialdehyde dehydrogenase (acetylating) / methylmalonate-semialdehyde dehydrogenase
MIQEIINPATDEMLAPVPMAGPEEVTAAIAAGAFPMWRKTPPQERVQYLFRFRALLAAR